MNHVLLNDTIVPRTEAKVDIDDRGYQFGDGVYEVARIYRGKLFLFEPHLQRLYRSSRELGIPLQQLDESKLREQIAQLISLEGINDGILYIQLTRGVHPRVQSFLPETTPITLTAYVREYPRPEELIRNGIHALLVPDIRWLRCDIKSLNLLPNILARQQALQASCFEAIQRRDDIVTEGAFSNAWIVTQGTVQTHPRNNLILGGITRAHLLDLCRAAAIPVREEPFTQADLFQADEAFITSTTNEVMPVTHINQKPIGASVPGPVTRRLQELYEASFSALR